jgi:hypothetical protein
MENLISTLAIGAITGISILAYKHPNAYRKISLVIMAVIVLVYIGAAAWSAGNDFAVQVLYKYLKFDQSLEAAQLARSYQVSPWWYLAGIGLQIYLLMLQGLPWLLRDDKPEEK